MHRVLPLSRLVVAPAATSSLRRPHNIAPLRSRASVGLFTQPLFREKERKGKHSPRSKPTTTKTMATSTFPLAVDKTPPSAPSNQTVSVAPDPATGAKELGRLVNEAAARAIAEKGSFTLVLSGGSLVDALASSLNDDGKSGESKNGGGEIAAATARDGSKWRVFWADERLVPGDSPDSNAGGAKAFLEKAGIPKENVHALADPPAPCPHEAAKEYESWIRSLPIEILPVGGEEGKMPVFDLVLLGVGPDGHVASLFPGLPAVDIPASGGSWVVGVENSPKPPPLRVSLTLPAITSAKEVVIVAFGAGKGDIISKALTPGGSKSEPLLPVQRVKNARWLIDAAAAKGLEEEQKKE